MPTLVILLLAALLAEPGRAATLDEVLACVARNAPKTALVQTVVLTAQDRTGAERVHEAKLMARRFEDGLGRVLLRVEAPADLRGTAFLLIQKEKGSDMFVYLPELKKVRRVTTRSLGGKLLGTDFSYEELERLFAQSRQGDVKLLADAEKDGRKAYALEATPAPDAGSAYTRVTSLVDQQTCVPLEIAFYQKGDAPRKVLSVDPARVTQEAGIHVPRLVVMRDLERGTETRLETHAIQVDPKLPNALFSRGSLDKDR